jgi:hypothetical protein
VDISDTLLSRRGLIKSAAVLGGLAVAGHAFPALAMAPRPTAAMTPEAVPPTLMKKALAALQSHGDMVAHHDRIAVVDFSAPSSRRRLHIVDLVSGKTESLLVAHGRGSDPAHTGWLQQFSNQPGSAASSQGAYVTGDYYVGNHGRSQRLIGLDQSNDNALARAIVIHSAWYADPDMIRTHGMLGRSEGCFAVGQTQLQPLFDRLGEGRLIYADKV